MDATSPTPALAETTPTKDCAPGRKGDPRHFDVAQQYLLARGLRKDGEVRLRWWRGSFWRWAGKAYEVRPDDDVFADVMRYVQAQPELRKRCTRSFVGNVIANLHGLCGVEASTIPPAWLEGAPTVRDPRRCLVLENGLLDLVAFMDGGEDVLREHSPSFFAMNALPFAFDPDAQCPLWRRFLDQVLPDPLDRALLQRWFGYCLLPESWLQKFLVLVGEGSNGKSVACKTLTALLGEENVAAVPVERFRDTHNLAETLGKLANVVSEFEEIDRATEGILKAYVAGDPMQFNPKYKPTFTARPTARLVVATNDPPHFRDKSLGMWRRTVILRFPVQIAEADHDPHLPDKLKTELPGILVWALLGLHDLLHGGLQVPPSSADELERHRRACNSALAFIEEHLQAVPGSKLPKQEVYEQYRTFCVERGSQALSEPNFAKEIYRHFGEEVATSRVRIADSRLRSYVYVGLGWAADDVDLDEHTEAGSPVESSHVGESGPGGPGGPGTHLKPGK